MGADIQPYIGSQSFLHSYRMNCYRSQILPDLVLTHIIIIWGRQLGILR